MTASLFWRLSPYLVAMMFILGYAQQVQSDAVRELRIEEQFAVIDAARRAGRTVMFTSIYDPGTVVKSDK